MYPESELPASEKELKGFTWREASRPREVMDIFVRE
jgi:hypothetical protein